jgi:hypothetical protein
MEEAPEQGSCINCGFLCRHDNLNTHISAFVELTEDDRRIAEQLTALVVQELLYSFHAKTVADAVAGHLDVDGSGVRSRGSIRMG